MKLVIFDLDGVIVSTDDFHFRAWKAMADGRGWHFDEKLNHQLRGVSRAESLAIILKENDAEVSGDEESALLDEKNRRYRELLEELSPNDILPGVRSLLRDLRSHGVLIAIGSSSRNTPLILSKIGMSNDFDAVVDGNAITHSKPHPEVFLKGAEALGISPGDCIVVEDAQAGVDAAIAAKMKVIGVGDAGLSGADVVWSDLESRDWDSVRSIVNGEDSLR